MYQNQVNPFRILPIIYCFLFILLILSEKIFLKTNFYEKVFSNSIILLIFLLIEFALFGANTADGSLVINGVQGRYFIPILFVIPLLISKNKINIKNKNIIFEIGFIINIFVLLTMFNAFII